MSLNNNTADRNYVEARAVTFYRNLWVMLYSFAVIVTFVAGGVVASKFSRKAEIATIDIAIVNQNAQPAVPVASDNNCKANMLAAASQASTDVTDAISPITPSSAAVVPNAKSNQATVVASVVKPVIVTVRSKDNLRKIFARVGIDAKNATEILAIKQAKVLKDLHAGKKINLIVDPSAKSGIKELAYGIDDLNTIIVTSLNNGKWQVRTKHIKPVSIVKYASATVGSSIYAAGKKAGISSKLIARFVSIFDSKVGKIRSGDKFALFYEERTANGKKIGESDIVAAELFRGDKAHRIIGFSHDGHTDFYTTDGHSLKSSFVRHAVKFERISSGFSAARRHPILGITRPHLGVDLAAPTGTPVKATSNGKIEYIGYKGGHGRTVIIRNGVYSTLYAHLSKFPKDIQVGSYVRQGHVIGYVGSSGLATAPHLHYEFRENGVHRDPLKVKLPSGEMIASEYRGRFFALSKKMLAQLDSHRRNQRMYAMYVDGVETQFK